MRVKTLVLVTGLCLVGHQYALVGPQALASPLIAPAPLHAADPAVQLRAQGNEHEYNLRLEQALARFRQAVEANPNDPASYRAVAAIYLMKIAFQRGAVTADDFLGGEVGADALDMPKPPVDLARGVSRQRDQGASPRRTTGAGPTPRCGCALSAGMRRSACLPPIRPRLTAKC